MQKDNKNIEIVEKKKAREDIQQGITFSKELINIAWHKFPREKVVNVSMKNDLMLLVIHRQFYCMIKTKTKKGEKKIGIITTQAINI